MGSALRLRLVKNDFVTPDEVRHASFGRALWRGYRRASVEGLLQRAAIQLEAHQSPAALIVGTGLETERWGYRRSAVDRFPRQLEGGRLDAGSTHVGRGPAEPPLVFDPVWLVLQRPRPNLDPPQFFAPGKLTIYDSRVEFGPSSARLAWPFGPAQKVHLSLSRVVDVSRQRYGWGLVPRFVAVTYESSEGTSRAYFNDAAWKGWRPLLTRSNQRMVAQIRKRLGLN